MTTAFAIGLLAMPNAALGQTPDWQTLTVPELSFSVELPGEPLSRENNMDPPTLLALTDYVIGLGDGFVLISVLRFKPEVREANTEEQLFRYAIDSYLGDCGANQSETPVTVPRGTGMETVRACDGATFKTDYVLAGDRLYRLSVGGPGDISESPDAERIFASFEVLAQ